MHVGLLYQNCGPKTILFLSMGIGISAWLLLFGAMTNFFVPYALLLLIGFLQGQAQAMNDCLSCL